MLYNFRFLFHIHKYLNSILGYYSLPLRQIKGNMTTWERWRLLVTIWICIYNTRYLHVQLNHFPTLRVPGLLWILRIHYPKITTAETEHVSSRGRMLRIHQLVNTRLTATPWLKAWCCWQAGNGRSFNTEKFENFIDVLMANDAGCTSSNNKTMILWKATELNNWLGITW